MWDFTIADLAFLSPVGANFNFYVILLPLIYMNHQMMISMNQMKNHQMMKCPLFRQIPDLQTWLKHRGKCFLRPGLAKKKLFVSGNMVLKRGVGR